MAAWVIPRGFQAQLLDANESAPVQLIVDGADVMAAQTAVEVGEGVAAAYGANFQLTSSHQSPAPSPLNLSLRVWFNEELKESNFMIPSELGFIAAAIAAMLASMMIARERELGTLEQLMVTPIRTLELVVGKSILALALGYTEFLLMLGMMLDIFSALVIVVPLILPIAAGYGIDPIHLGMIFLANMQIGYCTPPVGMNLFIASYRFDKPIVLLYRAAMPFLAILLLTVLIITYWPWLSLVLVR